MASSQNRFLNQTVASAQKTQTPNKLTQSTSSVQFAAANTRQAAQVSNSALDFHSSSTGPATLLPSQQQMSADSQPVAVSANSPLKGGSLTQSQANLRTNMFTKTSQQNQQQQQPGYQPSYLREPTHKASTYSSVSPMKHQARLQQSTSSVKKYGQHFSTSKRNSKMISDSKSTLGFRNNTGGVATTGSANDSKLRSGSQYVAAKKLYSGHHHHGVSNSSTSRGGHATQAQARMQKLTEEYQGGEQPQQQVSHPTSTTHTQRSTQQPPVENSFTRLHQGNSSVVRTYERKHLLQQSTSQVRKSQQPQSSSDQSYNRFQQSKFRNSNATSSNTRASGQNHQLFHTKDRASTNSQAHMAQPYISNNSAQGGVSRPATQTQPGPVNPMDSDRTADSGKCDTARNGNNRYKGQTKQPRQSKSSSTKQNPASTPMNQLRQQVILGSGDQLDRSGGLQAPPHSNSSALAVLTTPSQVTPTQQQQQQQQNAESQQRMAAASQQIVLSSQPSSEQAHNLPNNSGLETSLSFTRRLIEETAARNERQKSKDEGKTATAALAVGQEQDISNIAVSIESNLISSSAAEDNAAIVHATTSTASNFNKKLEINTSSQDGGKQPSFMPKQQQFISPKMTKPGQTSAIKFGQSSAIVVSPINSRLAGYHHQSTTNHATVSNDKKVRGTSNNKISNFNNSNKAPAALNAAFSPDKRPNISRSQIQNNFYLKRGGKTNQINTEKSNTRENNNKMHHQRMFAGQNQLQPQHQQQPSNNTPGNSVSPSTKTGPQHSIGPSYMQSTFSRSTKTTKNPTGSSNIHNYQLNRVRPNNGNKQASSQSNNTTQDNIPQSVADGNDKNNTSSTKDLLAHAAVKVLDQQAAPQSLTQSQGPPKIGNVSAHATGRQTQNTVYSKPNIGGAQSATKKTKSTAQSYQWQGGMSGVYPGGVCSSSGIKDGSTSSKSRFHNQNNISSGTHKQSRNLRPPSKRNSNNTDFKKQAQTVSSSLTAKSPISSMAAHKHHAGSSTTNKNINNNSASTQSVEWQRRQNSLTISDQFAKGAIDQPNTKLASAKEDYLPRTSEMGAAGAAGASSKLQHIYQNTSASQSEIIDRSSASKSGVSKAGGGAANNNCSGSGEAKQVKKKCHSSMTENSAMTNSDANTYKQKQEQIIEMIQSNMKRSEDIQQSLSSGSKFFQSTSIAPATTSQPEYYSSAGKEIKKQASQSSTSEQQQDNSSSLHLQTFGNETAYQMPLLKAPSPSKATSSFTSNDNQQPDIPQFYNSAKPMLDSTADQQAQTKPSEPPLSEIGQEQMLDVVEDVFNDAQLLTNQRPVDKNVVQPSNSNANTAQVVKERISLLPEIQPAEQPDDGSSSEGGDLLPGELQSPIALLASISLNSSGKQEPQSAFAMALANKKANGEDFRPTATVNSNLPNVQPFDQAEENDKIQKNKNNQATNDNDQPQDAGYSKELEVVAEDVAQEDRYSMLSAAAIIPAKSLPMKRDDFIALYKTVMTEQESAELLELELTDGMVYYANDIPTRISSTSAITNSDDEDGYYVLQARDQILYRFEVIKVLGKGSFAQVVSAIDHLNGQRVAVKVNRNTEIDHKFAKQEGKLLRFLMDEDPSDENNIVRLVQHIHFRQHQCFVFELLNTDLFEHLKETEFSGFNVEQIRSYAAQLLKALVFLEKRQVIHCDLKPENILCVDPARSLLKVVDFGSGCLVHEQVYTYVQSRYYRAPEVILRIRYSEKVDMWSLGCILAELYTGEPLFPGNNEQEQLEFIMELLGMFPESMIDKSRKKEHYFDTDYSPFLIEDPKYGILRIPESRRIDEAIPSSDALFLDFVAHCLILDPEKRPGASEAIKHPWIRSFFGGPSPYQSAQIGPFAGQQMVEREFDLPETSESAAVYVPLRQPKKVQSFQNSHHESLDELQGNLMMANNNNGTGIGEEYFEGRVSVSHQTEMGGFGNADGDMISDADQVTVKFGQSIVSQSRQREEAGARASAAEISPDRPIGSFLSDQQRMTSFISSSGGNNNEISISAAANRQSDSGFINLQPVVIVQQSTSKQQKASPLKPSNESLLEHYKYEKQSKGQQQNSSSGSGPHQNNFAEQLSRSAKKQHSANKPKQQQLSNSAAAANVEEPKIISMTTSGFTQQQK